MVSTFLGRRKLLLAASWHEDFGDSGGCKKEGKERRPHIPMPIPGVKIGLFVAPFLHLTYRAADCVKAKKVWKTLGSRHFVIGSHAQSKLLKFE